MLGEAAMGLKILHFGDVHLPVPEGARRTLAVVHPKRLPALLNFALRRGRKYADGERKLEALHEFARREAVDWIVYTGDSVNMGLASEFVHAGTKIASVLREAKKGAMATPGNHDLYAPGSERGFRRWMDFGTENDWPEAEAKGEGWPKVRFLDAESVLVGLNTARPHWAFWNSSGGISAAQLEALERVLDDPAVAGRKYILLATHYPLDEAGAFHGMRGTERLMRVLAGRKGISILHGHNHHAYRRVLPGTDIPLYCCGSLTKEGDESCRLYELFGGGLNARIARWRNARFVVDGD